MITDAQRRANQKYRKAHLKRIAFTLNLDSEKDLIEIYDSIENKQEWFRECLRKEKEADLIDRKELLDKIEDLEREPNDQHDGEDWLDGVIFAEDIIREM